MPFKKGQSGNPNGKPKGALGKKTKQWEALADSICGEQAEYFSQYIKDLWTSRDSKKKAEAAELYLKTVEYFKPKQSRVEAQLDEDSHITVRIIRE